jgi:hypothetical protein
LGIRIPPTVIFSPSVVLTNPHDDVLEIYEAFSSGSFLQLALPESKQKVDANRTWDLLPWQTKSILQLGFTSGTPGRFHGFISLRTNKGTLFLRLDLIVVAGGLYLATPVRRKKKKRRNADIWIFRNWSFTL